MALAQCIFSHNRTRLFDEQAGNVGSIKSARFFTRQEFLQCYINTPSIHHFDHQTAIVNITGYSFDAVDMDDYLVAFIEQPNGEYYGFVVHPADKKTGAYNLEDRLTGCKTVELFEKIV